MGKPDLEAVGRVFTEELRFKSGRMGRISATPGSAFSDDVVRLEIHVDRPETEVREEDGRFTIGVFVSKRFLSCVVNSMNGRKGKGKIFPGKFGALDPAKHREISMKGVEARRRKNGHA